MEKGPNAEKKVIKRRYLLYPYIYLNGTLLLRVPVTKIHIYSCSKTEALGLRSLKMSY